MHEPSPNSIVDRIFEEHRLLVEHLVAAGEVSLQNNVDSNFRKTLLLSAASYFEVSLCDGLMGLISESSGGQGPIVEFVRNKAIARQYYTFFDWDARNANRFFGLFGVDFRQFMANLVNNDSTLGSSIAAFLELGQLRNQLLHQNFANFPLEKTVDEIYESYRTAHLFVSIFLNELKGHIQVSHQPRA